VLGEGVSCGALPLGAVRAGSLRTRPYTGGGGEGAAERKRAKLKKKKRQSTFLSLKFILTIII